MRYRKRPVVIEAVQWTGENTNEIYKFAGKAVSAEVYKSDGKLLAIETLEGTMYAPVGDYIIKGVDGEFYPCKPDIFEKTYEIPKFNFPPRYIDADKLIEKLTYMGYFDDDNGDELYEIIMRFVNEDV